MLFLSSHLLTQYFFHRAQADIGMNSISVYHQNHTVKKVGVGDNRVQNHSVRVMSKMEFEPSPALLCYLVFFHFKKYYHTAQPNFAGGEVRNILGSGNKSRITTTLLKIHTHCHFHKHNIATPHLQGTHCSALMYSLSMGMHITFPTRTPERTSSNFRPRFSPIMVKRVPPCRGPVSGNS